MKYFFIFLISFSIITPAYAVKQVPGSMPVVQPLQPPSAFAQPDFSGNVQSNGSADGGQATQSPANQTAGLPADGQLGAGQALPPQLAAFAGHRLFLWLAALLALIVLAWVWFRQRKNNP